jgi:hypothetical protein
MKKKEEVEGQIAQTLLSIHERHEEIRNFITESGNEIQLWTRLFISAYNPANKAFIDGIMPAAIELTQESHNLLQALLVYHDGWSELTKEMKRQTKLNNEGKLDNSETAFKEIIESVKTHAQALYKISSDYEIVKAKYLKIKKEMSRLKPN